MAFVTMSFSYIRPISLRDQVVAQVRTAIIEGRLKPNDHITEAVLTRELGVSRTPVREALILLEREGLVVSTPNRGAFVRAFDEQAIEEIFSSRVVLENFAAELIIDRLEQADFEHLHASIEQQHQAIIADDFKQVRSIDMEFHHYLIERSEHGWLQRNWDELVAQIAALLYMRAEGLVYNEYLAVSDHQEIVGAFEDHDLERVYAAHRRINARVAAECKEALRQLAE